MGRIFYLGGENCSSIFRFLGLPLWPQWAPWRLSGSIANRNIDSDPERTTTPVAVWLR